MSQSSHTLTFIEDKGKYSIVRKGSVIYRGQTDAFDIVGHVAILKRNVIKPGQHTYFGLNPEQITENYGITAALTVNTDLNLLNINNVEAHQWLQALMEEKDDMEAMDALIEAFPYDDERNVVMRDSDKKNDMTVLNFICSNTDYEGYIQPKMPKREGGFMHGEMAVCSRSGFTKINQPLGQPALPAPAGRSYQGLKDEMQMRLHGQAMEARRAAAARRRRDSPSDESPFKPLKPMRLFD